MFFKLINRLKFKSSLYNCINVSQRNNTQNASNAEKSTQTTHFGFETVEKSEKAGKGNNFLIIMNNNNSM